VTKPAGDFLERQMRHSLTLNKSSRELMSAITVNFDLALQAIPYPSPKARAFGIASLARTLIKLNNASNLSRSFRII